MSISKLKNLIYKVENILKNDDRFNPEYRRRMKFIYYENNKNKIKNPIILNKNIDTNIDIDLTPLDKLQEQTEANLQSIKEIL